MKEYSIYAEMVCTCYDDIACAYPALHHVEISRDLATIRQRFANEGVCFLTKTLPALARAIDYALSNGTALQAPSFSRRRGSKLPKFLGWLIGRVFSTDGLESHDSCPYALSQLRQLLYLLAKLELPYASELEAKVIASFIEVDAEVGSLGVMDSTTHLHDVRFARGLIGQVLSGTDPRDIIPRHGPGAVADGQKPWEKMNFNVIYSHAEEVYPFTEYYHFNLNHTSQRIGPSGVHTVDECGCFRPLKVLPTSTAKVVLVPKDSRGPRLISMEPLEIQWLQQGQLGALVSAMETSWLTRGHVNFENQKVNGALAQYASACSHARTQGLPRPTYRSFFRPSEDEEELLRHASPESDDLVTLDMKDASDRVSIGHVACLFPSNWVEALFATRSSATRLPDGRVIPLHKFAPMGSAVCFPLEAIVFWALSVAAIHQQRPELSLNRLRKRVWVFGDDLVIHRDDYPVVIATLERYGLRFNRNKCCVAGSFRESCGVDAFKGVLVTPVRIKAQMGRRLTATAVLSYVAYSNAFHDRCYYKLSRLLEGLASKDHPIAFTSDRNSQGKFVRPYNNVVTLNRQNRIRMRFNKRLHRLEAFALTTSAVVRTANVDSYEGLLHRGSSTGLLRSSAPENSNPSVYDAREACLEAGQFSIPRRVVSKRGWTPIAI